MRNAIINFPLPQNEPVKGYLKGSPERVALEQELERQKNIVVDIPIIIGGKEIRTGDTGEVRCPHDHKHVLATYHKVGEKEIQLAIDTAMEAWKEWSKTDWTVRAGIALKMAELLATKYRPIMNAACMLGQSKNFYQAEIARPSTSSAIMCITLRRSITCNPRMARATSTTRNIVRWRALCWL